MVGDPKWLSDLSKIDADVRVICRKCRFEQDWTVEALTRHLLAIGGNTAWSEVTRHLSCSRVGCGSTFLRAVAVPYARRPPNLPRRISKLDEAIVAAAVRVLEEATAHSPGRNVATIEVRLALLIAHRYARDQAAVRRFWERAGDEHRLASDGLSDPLGVIRQRLEQQGWLAPRSSPERIRTWPWQSPAPPGFLNRNGRDPGP